MVLSGATWRGCVRACVGVLLVMVCCENGTGAERAFLLCLQLLENLVIAVESEASIIDISRVSGFMQKVHSLHP